jgi:aspartate racemase
MSRGDWQGVGELILSSASKLATVGADFFICPATTIHIAWPHIESRMPIPGLHIATVSAQQALEGGFRCIGLLGTRLAMESAIFPEKLGERMKEHGCDAVVLGCTEIPLIMNDDNSPLPVIDSTRLLARAALRRAVPAGNATSTTR